jgi:hypothetical protein
MALKSASAFLLIFFAAYAPAQLSSVDVIGASGAIVVQKDKKKTAMLHKQIAAAFKDKAYWFKRMYAKKLTGAITVKLLVNEDGEVKDVATVSTTLSDTSLNKTLTYSLGGWKIEDVEFPENGVLITCTFAFDSSSADVPPWRFHGEFECENTGDNASPQATGIWNPKEKTCMYLEVPYLPTSTKRYGTFGNSEWKQYEESISRFLCSNMAQWPAPDSQGYVVLDSLLSRDTASSPGPLQNLPQEIAGKLSAAGFTRLVAFYRQRGQYTYHASYNSGSFEGGQFRTMVYYQNTPSVNFTLPTKSTDQSIIASVYDLKTGKGVFHKRKKVTDYSLADAVEAVIKDLFSQLKRLK